MVSVAFVRIFCLSVSVPNFMHFKIFCQDLMLLFSVPAESAEGERTADGGSPKQHRRQSCKPMNYMQDGQE